MKREAKNPFKFGTPVEGDYYFPRPGLSKLVQGFLKDKINVVLYGARRFGKTSFILDTIRRMEDKKKICILIDIFNVTSHKDFLQQIARALESKKNLSKRFSEWANGIPRLRPKVVYATDLLGNQTLTIRPEAISSEKDVKELIQDTLIGLQKLGDEVFIAIDEFQTVAGLADGGWLEATLRTQMQETKNSVFLFSGSRKGIIHDMFNLPKRPFYRTCQMMEFTVMPEEFTDWIVEKFENINIDCDRRAIVELRREVQETPNYVQMACYHLVAQNVPHVTVKSVKEVLHTIVKQNEYAYQTLLSSLAFAQQRAVRLAAIERDQIFAKNMLDKYQITSGPALASSIKALKQKQILDNEVTARGRVVFDDPLFAIWLKEEFGEKRSQ